MKNVFRYLAFVFFNCVCFSTGFGQIKRNFIGYEMEGSFFRPTFLGISYERHLINKTSISLHGNAVLQSNVQGFKVGTEFRYYFGKNTDSLTACKGWFGGVKPMYMHLFYPRTSFTSYNGTTFTTTDIPAYSQYTLALFGTFGRQWVWKNGLFLNVGVGIGVYQNYRINSNNSVFVDRSDQFINFVTGDIAIRIGYNF